MAASMNAPRSPDSDPPAELAEVQRDLMAAAQHAREEAGRARRLADTQTQADVISELKAYAEQLDRQAFLFDQQAKEFAEKFASTRRLARDIKQLADEARAKLQQMTDRLKRPPRES